MFEYDLGNIYDLLAGQEFGIYAGRGKKYWHRQVLPDDQFVVVLPDGGISTRGPGCAVGSPLILNHRPRAVMT